MNSQIIIDGRVIGTGCPPYIIAEMSANHNGSIDRALQLIEKAKECGADAVKLQTYTADTLTLKSNNKDFQIKEGLWAGQTLHELYSKAHLPWDWHEILFQRARDIGITIFSSPFDNSAVDLLEDLNAPAYKIASFEVVDLPLIRYVAKTGKPLIISSGMANEEEIQDAVNAAREVGCEQISVLHCVSGYPAPISDYNLKTISDLKRKFAVVPGLSDHTLNNTTAIVSVALGASLIEKHFTLDKNAGGVDDSFSMSPDQLKDLVEGCREAWEAIGKVDYNLKPSEISNANFRRSLYFVENLASGTIVQAHHIRSVRPGYGLAPKHFDNVVGRRLLVSVSEGDRVEIGLVE